MAERPIAHGARPARAPRRCILRHRRGRGRFNGQEKTNVEEYCVTEGWVRVAAGRARDRRGDPITLKLTGTVEPYFRDLPEAP